MNILASQEFPYLARAEYPLGTRFLVYPQAPFILGYERPEPIWLGPMPGRILAGPSDSRMYVVSPFDAKKPYSFPQRPPYPGHLMPPAEPGPDGHFDHLEPMTNAFLSAHAYACTRRTLDICESYIGRSVTWFFEPEVERLEIVSRLAGWDNAQSGFGFLELGETDPDDAKTRYGYNFDAIAHEMGHLILLSELGSPQDAKKSYDYFAYHESVADFISLLGLLHFDTALDLILRRTRGNLLLHNELDRFAELSTEKALRVLNNSLRYEDVGQDAHDRSKPFSAGLFDCLVEVYQSLLFESGLSTVDPTRFSDLRLQMAASEIEALLGLKQTDYEITHFRNKSALQLARDLVAECLFRSWSKMGPDNLTFRNAANAFLEAATSGPANRFAGQFEDCFRWRQLV